MVRYSVLIPQRNQAAGFVPQLVELRAAMAALGEEYEVLCIDDASADPSFGILQRAAAYDSHVRLLRLDRPGGTSVALAAGVAAARGEVIIAMAPGRTYRCDQIPQLIRRLSRADAVFGQRRLGGLAKWWQRTVRIPRWLLLGLEVRDPDCLFWAARREALAELEPVRGSIRYLSSLIAMRGFRVAELPVDAAGRARLGDAWPNPGDLLAAWWRRRRYRVRHLCEVVAQPMAATPLRIAGGTESSDAESSSSAASEAA